MLWLKVADKGITAIAKIWDIWDNVWKLYQRTFDTVPQFMVLTYN